MGQVIATTVRRVACVGCTEASSFSSHWPCLFPQHGPGKTHQRKIELVPGSRNWSTAIPGPDPGLLLSDGCRVGSVALLDEFVGPKR